VHSAPARIIIALLHLSCKGVDVQLACNADPEASSAAEYAKSEYAKALNVRLIMLLRDFDKDQLGGQTPSAHLEEWLKEEPLTGQNPTLENQNNVRRAIKRLFRQRDCFTMSPPSASTTNVAGRHLHEEFMQVTCYG
jgi:hypothetical protein